MAFSSHQISLAFHSKAFFFISFLQVVNATDKIVLNALDLTIDKAVLRLNGKDDLASKDITFSTEQETVTLTFGEELSPGEGVLDLSFAGKLNDKMKGFYRSKYFTPSGEERYGGVTQL